MLMLDDLYSGSPSTNRFEVLYSHALAACKRKKTKSKTYISSNDEKEEDSTTALL